MNLLDSDLLRHDLPQGAPFRSDKPATGLKLRDSEEVLRELRGRKLGVALLGLGQYATEELGPALRQTKLCYLAGVVTGHRAKGEKWAAAYNLDKKNIYSHEDLDRIADNKDIDIVYVVAPPAMHAEFAIRAAKAGKHVICEKPMATSVADCDRMIAACKAASVQLSIGYRLHFDKYHIEMARLAADQELGPFMKMSGGFSIVLPEHGFRTDKKLGGGPLMDTGIYLLHSACVATGINPTYVTAYEESKLKPELFDEVEETIRWTMDFPNGAKCHAVASFNQEQNQFRIEGKRGWVDFKQQAFSSRGIVCETSRGLLSYPSANQQAAQMDDFADCVVTGRLTSVPGELGRRDIQIIAAIYESARTGRRVSVPT